MVAIGGVYCPSSRSTPIPITKLADPFLEMGLRKTEVWPAERAQTQAGSRPVFGTFALLEHTTGANPRNPLYDEESDIVIVADARIDDQETLMHQLNMPPDRAHSIPACELILHAYRKWGESCPEHLIGDYAFAIWDGSKRQLFCARDHIGARPFFYQDTTDCFTFASDIRGVLAASPQPCVLNENYVAHSQISGNFYSKRTTYYEGVEKLQAGHSLTVDASGTRLRRYWDPRNVTPIQYADDAAYAEALRDLLGKAISDRIRSDSQFGIHISGGLDSSAIAQMATLQLQSQGRDKPLGLSWQPPAEDASAITHEHRLIDSIRDHTGLAVDHVVPDADGLYAMFLRDGTREPCGRTLLNEDAIQRHAATKNLGVILSGWGGDQSITYKGRSYYPELLLSGRWITLCRELRQLGRSGFKALWSQAIMPVFAPSLLYRYADWRIGKPRRTRQIRTFIHPEFEARMKPTEPKHYTFHNVRKSQIEQLDDGTVTRRLEAWAANARPHGIEYRYPLLDRRITEFALAIPSSQFKNGKWCRWVFRNAMHDILPADVCWNQIQSEKERVGALLQPLFETVDRIRNELLSGELTTSRGQYVDIPRLIEFTEPEKFKASQAYGSLQNTLKFLDLN